MIYLKRTFALLLLILFPIIWAIDIAAGYQVQALRVSAKQSAKDIFRTWKINYWNRDA